jgi:hypothetical protein
MGLCRNGFSSVLLGPYLSIADSNFINPWFWLSLRYELPEPPPPVLQYLIHIRLTKLQTHGQDMFVRDNFLWRNQACS